MQISTALVTGIAHSAAPSAHTMAENASPAGHTSSPSHPYNPAIAGLTHPDGHAHGMLKDPSTPNPHFGEHIRQLEHADEDDARRLIDTDEPHMLAPPSDDDENGDRFLYPLSVSDKPANRLAPLPILCAESS